LEAKQKGFIMSLPETEPHVHGAETNPHNVSVSRFLRAVSESCGGGNETSKHITFALVKWEEGGGFDENYREFSAKTPIFDLVFYVLSGRMRVTLGNTEKVIGPDTLVYCPSNVKHSMSVIGKGPARMIMIYGTGEGEKMGVPVYTKNSRK
jgi:mannose-6-phosphate isomerase-like protein (cupin superfamily)